MATVEDQLETWRTYRREWVLSDISAGLVLTAILVPVGMGYASASGLLDIPAS